MKTMITFFILISLTISSKAQLSSTTNPESSEVLETVRTFLIAYQTHDRDKFVSLLHPDVVWMQPGDNRISGIKKSKAELMQMGAQLSQLSAKTLKLEDVQYFAPHGNTMVCLMHWKAAQPTGAILDVKNVDVYTVENGKIIMVKVFSEDIEAENKFWGK
jgi:ketosteroid isomerase-like protein